MSVAHPDTFDAGYAAHHEEHCSPRTASPFVLATREAYEGVVKFGGYSNLYPRWLRLPSWMKTGTLPDIQDWIIEGV